MVVDSLGGYRVIRKLGDGARAEVFLGHSDEATESPVALKAYRAGAGDAVGLAEIEALHRGAGAHVVRLIDVGPDAEGTPVLVLERLTGGSLARALRQRDRLEPGEAITILAPLAETLARLHDLGVLHGGIGAEAVLFDANGAPVLACFGRSRIVEPGMSEAAREAEPGFAVDLAQFAALAGTVLERVPEPAATTLLEEHGTLRAFAARLFELGDPLAVRLDAAPESPSVPARLVRSEPIDEEPSPSLAALALPEWIQRALPSALPQLLARLRATLATVRRPVWLAAGAVAVALVVALVFAPSGQSPDAAPAPPTPSASPVTAVGPVTADDPVAAVEALLVARERCIRELSVLCLDAVGQPGSAALADDQALIRAVQEGGELPGDRLPDLSEATLVERLGDSAIVALGADSEPASVLLMKGEAGWRIREYLTG
jgi:tRNA A-37 threonylcarbamoyl transferase component Bud32